MPTPRGWMVGATGVALALIGWLLGAPDLERLGAGIFILLAIAVFVVRGGRHEITTERELSPHHLSVGSPATVTLRIGNHGRRTLPLLLVGDRMSSGFAPGSRFTVGGIEPGGRRELVYEVIAPRRGRVKIGPAEITRLDPFGLARSRRVAGGREEILVRPRVEQLGTGHRDPRRAGPNPAAARRPLGGGDQDFYTLREYAEGDDLRKIHWPSTAKRGRYTVRQEESRWQGRAAILLDDRAGVHHPDGFERAVEAAASLADLYYRCGFAFSLATAAGPVIGFGRGPLHVNRILDLLAEVNPSSAAPVGALARRLGAGTATAQASDVILVTGTVDDEAAGAITRLQASATQVMAVSFPQHRFGTHATKARWAGEQQSVGHAAILRRVGARCLTLGPEDSLALAWNTAAHSGGGEETWRTKPALA